MDFSDRHCKDTTFLALAGIGMLVAIVPVCAQTATPIMSASGLSASDTILTFTGTSSTFVPSYVGKAGGNTLTFTATNGMLAQDSEDNFGGAFASGTNLLETKQPDSDPSGPLTITFASGVQQFGMNAQDIDSDTQTFTFSLTSATGSLGSFTVGPSDNSNGAGQLVFLGASAPAGIGITSVIITSKSSSSATGDSGSNLFAIGPVAFKTLAAAPEPSDAAIWSLGLAILGALAFAARKCKSQA